MPNLLARKKVPRTGRSLNQRFESAHYPQASELCLFDFPHLIRGCIDALRAEGISRVHLKCLFIEYGKWQLHIQYFSALDSVSAERFSAGCDETGHYERYRLVVNSEIDVVWTKEGRR